MLVVDKPPFPTVIRPSWNQRCGFTPGTAWPVACALPPVAVLVVAFHGPHLVLADIRGRGATVPSGHIEAGESPEQAAVRETYEETGGDIVPGSLRLIGYHTYSNLTGTGEGVDRACPVYVAEIQSFGSIPDGSESNGYILVAPADISSKYFIWDELTQAFFDHALSERAGTTLI